MKYMGSKAKIAKEILPIILKNRNNYQYYVEPFCGGCNSIDKVDGKRLASDNNLYLIAMWKALQQGWNPSEEITRDYYNDCRNKYNNKDKDLIDAHILGYVGFNGSYGGRFFDGGYAGIVKTKNGDMRNYPKEAYNNVISQIDKIKNVDFVCCDYKELLIPKNSIIYCDPPYSGTKQYKTGKYFDYKEFWEWCREQTNEGHSVFISEYNAPDDFTCVWQKEVKSSLSANGVIGGNKNSIEKLFTLTKKEKT